ncbi:MAG: thiamine diphosphokinase [Dysgonamonadaceae bacterium]
MKKQSYTVIIANGEFPTHPEPLSYIENANRIICLDGALEACLKNNITPEAIVGDGDSISSALRKQYAHLLHIFTDQETNDLTKAVTYCVKNGFLTIKVIAATGKREDHTLGNISLLLDYMSDCEIEMITDYGIFTPISSTTVFESIAGQQVSIFNFDRTPISSHNLKYPLNKYVLDNLWKGTLNESLGKTFTVVTEGKTLVYQTFEVGK